MMVSTLSFLATTPEAWQKRRGAPLLSTLGEALLKDTVLLGAALGSGRVAARGSRRYPVVERSTTGYPQPC